MRFNVLSIMLLAPALTLATPTTGEPSSLRLTKREPAPGWRFSLPWIAYSTNDPSDTDGGEPSDSKAKVKRCCPGGSGESCNCPPPGNPPGGGSHRPKPSSKPKLRKRSEGSTRHLEKRQYWFSRQEAAENGADNQSPTKTGNPPDGANEWTT